MQKRIFVISMSLGLAACAPISKKVTDLTPEEMAKPRRDCVATREYITTYEYLKNSRDLGITESEAKKIAFEASKHCNGAANRFTRVARLLTRANLSGQDAIKTAAKLTPKSDKEVGAFVNAFHYAFLEDYLDMDLQSAVKIALSLTTEFDGSALTAVEDFKYLSRKCQTHSELSTMVKSDCGQLAGRIAQLGGKSNSSVGESFVRALDFALSEKGPNMKAPGAMKLAEELVAISPIAVDNFINGYKYAMNSSGLKMQSADAFNFARQMADNTMYAPGTAFREQAESAAPAKKKK